MNTTPAQSRVADTAERVRALDPRESFLVQAPAGSGKTELLTLRYLALLPTVEQPEHVLAITFTRKATAEMRVRVLEALQAAASCEAPEMSDHEREVRVLAQAALAHSDGLGWQLLEQPQRLNIQTIDSLALSIAHQMPLLSRLGGQLTPVDEAKALYALAAERVFAHLGDPEETELAAALENILVHRDASLPDCESLIAGMLERRDQWLLALPEIGIPSPPWDELRATLEEPFRREHDAVIGQLQDHPGLNLRLPELLELAAIACENGNDALKPLFDRDVAIDLTELAHWKAVGHFLLTGDKWRSRFNKLEGFPAATHRQQGERAKALTGAFVEDAPLLALLCRARTLPPCAYTSEEWSVVRSIFIVLRRAIGELRVVFAEQGVIDFIEAGLGAFGALQDPSVLMRQDEYLRHILVDEFQDTSRAHFAMLRRLLQEWQPGSDRTCFFVGDPMQSIYLFRGAEAQLFDQVRKDGLELDGIHYTLTTLRLTTNFRSTPAIVEPLNAIFARVLNDEESGSVRYAASISSKSAQEENAVQMHLQVYEKADARTNEELVLREADSVLSVIRSHLPAIERAKRESGKYRVAVLARNRSHLVEIIDRLRQARIPFRGVKIDLLRDRPEILDILSLLRALLHPADRIAWLAVLRAPWCGLSIPALHAICGDPDDTELRIPTADLLRRHADRLDIESSRRALHVLNILEHAQDAYAGGILAASPASLALWLEQTWHALGAPRFLDAEALTNTESFFATVAQMPPHCFGTLDEALNQRLEELYAQPDPNASEERGVHLMTIHGAKGLEFEVVLLPQLDRPSRPEDSALFQWLVRHHEGAPGDELLLAPIGAKHSDAPGLYQWVSKKATDRLRQEEKRLLYVACSRAVREIHLFATIERKANGDVSKAKQGSLLAAGWAGLLPLIERETGSPAASSNLHVMPAASSATASTEAGTLVTLAAESHPLSQTLRRLPADWFPDAPLSVSPRLDRVHLDRMHLVSANGTLRRGGNRLARAQGIVLHALLEHAARNDGKIASTDLMWSRLVDALLRQHALPAADAASARAAVMQSIHLALEHDEGRWLLGARENAQSEHSWSSVVAGRLQQQRPDRVFLGGKRPGLPGSDYLWIVDYKTASLPEDGDRDTFLASSRSLYRSQLEAYSELFRKLGQGETTQRKHRLALYHLMLPWLDWWPA